MENTLRSQTLLQMIVLCDVNWNRKRKPEVLKTCMFKNKSHGGRQVFEKENKDDVARFYKK